MPHSILACAAALCVATSSATAQATPRDTTMLPTSIVTATRLPGAVETQTATVTVLNGASLRAEGITHLGDALRRVPGLAVVRQSGFGSPTSLFMRGGQSNYVRLLVDGVPVNEPGGTLDLGRITLDDVERIEVVRGPASVLYGSEAVTGVIQVFTRAGSGTPGRSAEVGGGSYGARRAALGAGGAVGDLGWTLRGDHHASNGFLPFNNAYRNDGLVASLGMLGSPRTDARLTARYNASTYQYPTGSDGSVGDRNAERTEHRLLLGVDAGHRWTDRVESRLQLAFNELHPRTSDGADDASDSTGFYGYFAKATVARHQADLRTTVRLGTAQRISAGAEFARDAERGSSLSQSQFGDFPGEFRATRENRALYAQALGDAGRWSYTLGGRLDDNSAFGAFTTARAGLAYRLSESLRLRASAGSAFKAPNFFENFASGFTVGNPDLEPEQARSAELGVEAEFSRFTLRATGFVQRFTNLIQYTGTPPARGDPNYFNIAAANAGGLELELGLPEIAGVSASAGYTWTDTRVVDAGFNAGTSANFVTGGRLLRRPEHMASLRLSRAVGAAGAVGMTIVRTGEREDRDFSTFPAGIDFLAPYTTVDASADLAMPASLLRGARIQLRAENLANIRYEQVSGFATPGRTLYAGLKLVR